MTTKPKFKIGDKVRSGFNQIFYGRVIDISIGGDGSPFYALEDNNGVRHNSYEHFLQKVTLAVVQQDIKDLREKIDTIIAVALG